MVLLIGMPSAGNFEKGKQMTNEEQTVLMIRGLIESLPPDQADACKELAEFIRMNVNRAGDPVGQIALALVGAEYQAKAG